MSHPTPTAITQVLVRRSRQVVIVLEDLYQPHNASSILKTCDAFGVQDLYIINNRNQFQFDPQKSAGIEKWVDCHQYFGDMATSDCLTDLKKAGYQIAATSLRPGCISIDDLEVKGQLALCFGTEERGLSQNAHDLADFFLRIPMFGLTQSFNVSVTVALSLQKINRLLQPETLAPLTDAETSQLKQEWQTKNPNMDDQE